MRTISIVTPQRLAPSKRDHRLLVALCELLGNSPLALLELVLGLGPEDVTAPLDAWAVVVLRLEGVHQLGKLTLVLLHMQPQSVTIDPQSPRSIRRHHS